MIAAYNSAFSGTYLLVLCQKVLGQSCSWLPGNDMMQGHICELLGKQLSV